MRRVAKCAVTLDNVSWDLSRNADRTGNWKACKAYEASCTNVGSRGATEKIDATVEGSRSELHLLQRLQ